MEILDTVNCAALFMKELGELNTTEITRVKLLWKLGEFKFFGNCAS